MLAYDAGPGVGLGHRRRMEALQQALAARGVAAELAASGSSVEAAVVVVDSYLWRADDTSRFAGAAVVAVDELDRDLAVDVVVDPTPGATARAGRAKRSRAGAAYALLDPVLAQLRPQPVESRVGEILVAAGGADAEGRGAELAADVRARFGPEVAVRLALGPWGRGDAPSGVDVVSTTDGLGPFLAGSDLVVTAAGVTMMESLRLGRPTVAFVVADNQRPAASGVGHAALVVEPEQAGRAAADLAGDLPRRRALSAAGSQLVDGLGAQRMAGEILALL